MTRGKLKVGDKEWIIVIIESNISEGWQKMMFPYLKYSTISKNCSINFKLLWNSGIILWNKEAKMEISTMFKRVRM